MKLRQALLFFDRFDVPACRALIGDKLGHGTDTRHATHRRRAFAQASTILGQILELDRHAANVAVAA